MQAGDVVFAPRGEWHGFRNTDDRPVRAIFGHFGVTSLEEAGYEVHADQGRTNRFRCRSCSLFHIQHDTAQPTERGIVGKPGMPDPIARQTAAFQTRRRAFAGRIAPPPPPSSGLAGCPDRSGAVDKRRNDIEGRDIDRRIGAIAAGAGLQFIGQHRHAGELRDHVGKLEQLIQRDGAAQRMIVVDDAAIRSPENSVSDRKNWSELASACV